MTWFCGLFVFVWLLMLLHTDLETNRYCNDSTGLLWSVSPTFGRSCDRASLLYSFKYNQQDATLYNILYCCQCSTCFRRFLRPSSGAQNCTHSIWYMSSLLAATASGINKQTWHIPDVVCTVLSSWWWAEEPPETCRAAFPKLWSADHKWSSGSALVVLLDWTLVQKRQRK